MNDSINLTEDKGTQKSNSLSKKIIIAWILGIFALSASGWVGLILERYFDIQGSYKYGIPALCMSGTILSGIWLLRNRLDKGTPRSIGLGKFKPSILKFLLGMGLIIVPLILTLSIGQLAGWGNVTVHFEESIVVPLIGGMIVVFFFEALPEELLFRGYIFSNLNTKYKRWISALITIGLFAILPVILGFVQKYVIGMDIAFGGSDTITLSYFLNMIFFGAFVQYLRILTGSVWTGIGFHLIFVFMNHLIGLEPTNFIQVSDFDSEVPVQITLLSSIALVFITLLLYPKITKRKLGWKELSES
ncbi:MAG: CPBP family intramembrane metalloprotease [Crocinitomicaceae bacterium]|nr:CPBP family intramembrane metalloprotease [Crocinitomicaceae bacterium]